uniref:Uncharacterized protein n=1 Tax=viral metagenome TaxID=1070528 RepID=A0A6C0HQV2_9ZZZZ
MNETEMVFLQNNGITSNEYNINSLFLKDLLDVPRGLSVINIEDDDRPCVKSASLIKNSIYDRIVDRFNVIEIKEVDEPVKVFELDEPSKELDLDEVEDEVDEVEVEDEVEEVEEVEDEVEDEVEEPMEKIKEKPKQKSRKFKKTTKAITKKLKLCTKSLN